MDIRSPRASVRRAASLLVLWALAGASLACGATSTLPSQAVAGGASAMRITVRSASASTPPGTSDYYLRVSASCAPGEQMVGGGFGASNVFEYAAFFDASYPSAANTWTVSGGSISAFAVSVSAYCASASSPLGVRIVRSADAQSGTVACPAGSVLLSGGFKGTAQASGGSTAAVRRSLPEANGWQATAGEGAGAQQVYALCATQHVSAGTVARFAFNPHSTTNGERPEDGGAHCATGQMALGGGFAGGSLELASAANDEAFSAWVVSAGGNTDVSVYAVCVRLTA